MAYRTCESALTMKETIHELVVLVRWISIKRDLLPASLRSQTPSRPRIRPQPQFSRNTEDELTQEEQTAGSNFLGGLCCWDQPHEGSVGNFTFSSCGLIWTIVSVVNNFKPHYGPHYAVEQEYSQLSEREEKILYSLFRSDGLRLKSLLDKTCFPKRTLIDNVRKLQGKGLITKKGGWLGKYFLTLKGSEVARMITPRVEEETVRDAERRLGRIAYRKQYDAPAIWQLFNQLLYREFKASLTRYIAKAYVRSVRTGTPSDEEALKSHIENIWKVIDYPKQDVFDQEFDWEAGVKEVLDELNSECSVSKGRRLKALHLVKMIFENYSQNLFHDIKTLIQDPIRYRIAGLKPSRHPAFISPPPRIYAIVFAVGAISATFIAFGLFLIVTEINDPRLAQLLFRNSIATLLPSILLKGSLSLYGGIYLTLGLLLVVINTLWYRKKLKNVNSKELKELIEKR